MMYDEAKLVGLDNNEAKQPRIIKKVHISTSRSILLKYATLQFLGLLCVAIAVVIIALVATNTKEPQMVETVKTIEVKTIDEEAVERLANEKFEEYKSTLQPEVVTETVEVEKIVEVEKTVEIPVEHEVIHTVEVPVVQTVTVVDQEAVQQLATEMAAQMYAVYKETYTAEVDEAATTAAINEATEAIRAEYTAKMAEYVAQADAEQVATLATEMAQQMFEQFKTDYIVEYAAAQEAARVATVSKIRIIVILPTGDQRALYIEGSLHDELTADIIIEAVKNDSRFSQYVIYSIKNRDAVETFTGKDYNSTRVVTLKNK